MKTIYQNNSVEIQLEVVDEYESKVNVNGKNLIWICNEDADSFIDELSAVLKHYRI